MEFLNSELYYASKKIVNQSSDFPVRRTGSYRHKKHCVTVYDVIGSSMIPVGIQVLHCRQSSVEPQPQATSIELFLVLWTCGGRGGDHIPQEGQKNIFERELKINPATES